MTNQAFALDHPNYARYGTYQQTDLKHLRNIQHPANEKLKSNGFGASISGDKFSSIHGDLTLGFLTKKPKEIQDRSVKDSVLILILFQPGLILYISTVNSG